MEHAAHGEIPGDAFHVLHVAAEEAVFADGDAVGLRLVEAEEDTDGVGLLAGFEVAHAVDQQRPFGVLLEEGPLVVALAGAFVSESGLADVRRGRILRVGEAGIPVADGAVGDAVHGLAEEEFGRQYPAGFDDESQCHCCSPLGLNFVVLIDEHREQDLARVGQQPGRDCDALNGVGSADVCAGRPDTGVVAPQPGARHPHRRVGIDAQAAMNDEPQVGAPVQAVVDDLAGPDDPCNFREDNRLSLRGNFNGALNATGEIHLREDPAQEHLAGVHLTHP
ncbi:protein of unknown function [Pseudodesulfovibrio profundus]|uniref:Uncharacterized protein n=1 Tax=Pseudodesulfovibrio profundus TaxID=57320 RepID=A0A2C8F527_9BACT|nr:protein of unknown function [Pseudodesulfovibrio profundus]